MDQLIRRKSGGQPGNRNARVHGLYSKVLSQDEKRELKYAGAVDGLDQEIAILRVKFRSLLAQDGQNLRLINQTADTLSRLYHVKYSLTKTDVSKLKEAFTAVLDEFIIAQPPAPSISDVSPPPLKKLA